MDELESIFNVVINVESRQYPSICLGEPRNTTKNIVSIAGYLAETQTEHLPNMSEAILLCAEPTENEVLK
jgi:hypothetical protein